jgi:aryl-alcohol dehydrogenase-like predicted oxidoreductase
MRRVRFGRTEQKVSAIGFGTWAHGGPMTVGNQPVGWSGHDELKAREALMRAWELGINHWDTADVYGDGQAERLIGSLWEDLPRAEIFLATKVGWDRGRYPHYYHPDLIRARAERSLELLRTDRIDLYYLHHCDFGRNDRYLEPAAECLLRLREEGKVRFLGLSDWSSKKLARVSAKMDPDVVQAYRNVLDDSYEASGLKGWVEKNDAGVAFFSPLKHGLLLGKYRQPKEFPEGDMRSRFPAFRDRRLLERLRANRAAIIDRFPHHPEAPLHALTGYLLADAPTGSVLVGQRDRKQAEAAATLGEALGLEDALRVSQLYSGM